MKIKGYIILAAASIILMILATSAMIVALGLLTHESAKGLVAVYNVAVEGAIVLKDSWEFVRSVGAF
jgi:hypothetical protein